jgi:hypothetical protein
MAVPIAWVRVANSQKYHVFRLVRSTADNLLRGEESYRSLCSSFWLVGLAVEREKPLLSNRCKECLKVITKKYKQAETAEKRTKVKLKAETQKKNKTKALSS